MSPSLLKCKRPPIHGCWIGVAQCPRCGQDHGRLKFEGAVEHNRRAVTEHVYFAQCPNGLGVIRAHWTSIYRAVDAVSDAAPGKTIRL